MWIQLHVPQIYVIVCNRPFSKMAAKNSIKLKLAKIKNTYHHQIEHLYFSDPVKFQHFRCNVSCENVGWKLRNLQTFVWLGVCSVPPVIQTSVNFSIFNLHFSADITPEMLKLCRVTKVKVFFLVMVYVFNFDLFEFSGAVLEKGLLQAVTVTLLSWARYKTKFIQA